MKVSFTGTPRQIAKEMKQWLGEMEGKTESYIDYDELFEKFNGDIRESVSVQEVKDYCEYYNLNYQDVRKYLLSVSRCVGVTEYRDNGEATNVRRYKNIKLK